MAVASAKNQTVVKAGASPKVKPPKEHTYLWVGTDRKGAKLKGEMVGPSETFVKQQLRKQGVAATSIKKALKLFSSDGKVTAADISIFARQIATMMSSGVPLVQALEIIGRGHEKPAVSKMIMDIKSSIEGGNSFAESLARHPLHFDDLFVNLVDAGERSGALETLLDKIATYKEKTEAIKKKVKKALTYPAAVLVVAVIVTAILLIFVVPQFEELFKGFGADLPAFTKMVVGLSRWLQDNGLFFGAILIGIGVGLYQFHRRSRNFQRFLDRMMLKVPVIGDILYKSAVARFARTLSTMFAAGVPLVDAMDSVARAAGHIVFTEAILGIKDQVATGTQLQLAMSQTKLFPPMAVQMVAIGEEAGALDAMCAKVADFYEAEVDNLVDALSSLLEPMIMVILGGLVGSLVVAMYLPIFKLGSVI